MRKVLIVGILGTSLVSALANAQHNIQPVHLGTAQSTKAVDQPPVPTELEQAKLESSLKDLTIMSLQFKSTQDDIKEQQSNLEKLQKDYQTKNEAIDTQFAAVKKAHGWGDDVSFNKQTGKAERIPNKK